MTDPTVDILSSLNPEQKSAVLHGRGPLMIIAGAGSGKTRVITHRIAHLIASGCPADSILAITFTNKAAGEMRDRTEKLTGISSRWISTFHSFGARVLRKYIYRIEPYDTSFTICDPTDCKSLMKELLKDLDIPQEAWEPRSVLAAISHLKSQEGGDVESLGSDYRNGQLLRNIYLEYSKRMQERNLLDFDDLLLLQVRLFKEHPDVLDRYREQFEFILIDEYQDTNALQYDICRFLTSGDQNLCITGDPDQSIYKWRGADIGNILNFERDYPDAKVIKLERNYRSSANILRAANTLIAHNIERKPKDLWTDREPGDPVRVCHFHTEQEESMHIVHRIREEAGAGRPLGEIAIFYRINSLSRAIEQALIYANIPYNIVGGLAFFLRKEIKDVISMMRILDNPRDSESLKRIINMPPRGIGKGTVEKLQEISREQGRGLLEIVLKPALQDRLNRRQKSSIGEFRKLYNRLESLKSEPMELLTREIIRETGYEDYLHDKEPDEAHERISNLSELTNAATEYDKAYDDGDLRGFLEMTAILGDVDRWERQDDRVSLMTIHSAKGLEFPVVHVVGVERGILPLIRADEEPDMEEERRLLYVAITRAQDRVVLTHTASRMRFGRGQLAFPSDFLRELQPQNQDAESEFDYLKMDLATEEVLHRKEEPASWDSFPAARRQRGMTWDQSAESPDPFADDSRTADSGDPIAAEYMASDSWEDSHHAPDDGFETHEDPYPVGVRVAHADYGEGLVSRTSGIGRLRRVTVQFDDHGAKQFVVQHANLTRVD